MTCDVRRVTRVAGYATLDDFLEMQPDAAASDHAASAAASSSSSAAAVEVSASHCRSSRCMYTHRSSSMPLLAGRLLMASAAAMSLAQILV